MFSALTSGSRGARSTDAVWRAHISVASVPSLGPALSRRDAPMSAEAQRARLLPLPQGRGRTLSAPRPGQVEDEQPGPLAGSHAARGALPSLPASPRRNPPPEGDPPEYEAIAPFPFARKGQRPAGVRGTCREDILRGSQLTIHRGSQERQGRSA